jgi:hypothetical protein
MTDEDRAKLQAYSTTEIAERSSGVLSEANGSDASPPAIVLFLQQIVLYVAEQGHATGLDRRECEPIREDS